MAITPAMYRGVSPSVLLQQVTNTAAWALDGPTGTPETQWRSVLQRGASVVWDGTPGARGDALREDYLALLLAAHHATVATFVPTDVDSHLRHHAWQRAGSPDELRVLLEILDRVDAWDPREVSARVVTVPTVGDIHGHNGEWLGVRAGALGRALALGDNAGVEQLTARIDGELAREALAWHTVADRPGSEPTALCLATTLAHNVGDLSRVVEAWPAVTPDPDGLREKYRLLGHGEGPRDPRAQRWGGAFAWAGHVNKHTGMAVENHRFLPLRAARGLRLARGLLLPIGPMFDAWGEAVARHPEMKNNAGEDYVAGAVAALVEGHLGDPTQEGYLRALAGIHRGYPGGLDALAGDVPARLRRSLRGGAVREALGMETGRLEARMRRRYKSARAVWG